jgi:hypothetical protein
MTGRGVPEALFCSGGTIGGHGGQLGAQVVCEVLFEDRADVCVAGDEGAQGGRLEPQQHGVGGDRYGGRGGVGGAVGHLADDGTMSDRRDGLAIDCDGGFARGDVDQVIDRSCLAR